MEEENLTPEQGAEPEGSTSETGTEDINANPAYIAMKEVLENQNKELEKLHKEIIDLKVEREKMALQFGSGETTQEALDNAWLGFSRYAHDKK